MASSFSMRRLILACLATAGLLGVWANSGAQSIQLSSEQQRMLDQLPPAQRQQALDAIRQVENQAAAGSSFSTLNDSGTQPSTALTAQVPVATPPDIEQVASAGATLIVQMALSDQMTPAQLRRLESDPALAALEGSQVYRISDDGVLDLPGVATVDVLGLTAEEIQLRLGAEPVLSTYVATVSVLEPERTGPSALRPFGYDVFRANGVSFDPVTTGPVPPDYVLGPGDSVRVQLFGNVNGIYEFEVSRDGVLNLPELGPITVAGLPFSEFRSDLDRRVAEMLIGTQVSATMGRLRTIRVFVLGDAERPGSYVVSSLATISSAIYAAGGISEIGSLRDVQLKRNGVDVARLDLYDLLLRGDTSDDRRLQPGDVVFIPPVGAQVSIDGAVKRPAIYEARPGTFIADAIDLAGGLSADAFSGGARIERIASGAGRVVLSLNASGDQATRERVQAGDLIVVPEVLPEYDEIIELIGHVHRPGPVQWRSGMRLSSVIGSLALLRPGADPGYLLIRREDPASRAISVVSADLGAAVAAPGSVADIPLMPRDQIHVFSLEYGRQRVIEPLLEDLQRQAVYGAPNPVVTVSGTVRAPGNYPLEPTMRISDLLRAAGDLSEEAYTLSAELVRYDVVNGEYRSTEVLSVDLAAVLRGDSTADVELAEHDNLRISTIPDWNSLWTVSLAGEVTFPGEYRIRRGETLAQLLDRAGGLTDAAYPEGAVFLRESLRLQEQQQIELLSRRLEADLTSLSLQNSDTRGGDTLSTGQELLAQLRSTEATGRLVIDLPGIASGETTDSPLELRDGDRLLVPKQPQSVTVIGETQQNTSHLYDSALSREDYIALSGGVTRRADRGLIYVVRANGAVEAGRRSRWFGRGGSKSAEIRPGDTIVVPLETDRVRPLTLWTGVTQILYQAAIAIAAIETFND